MLVFVFFLKGVEDAVEDGEDIFAIHAVTPLGSVLLFVLDPAELGRGKVGDAQVRRLPFR